jgi:hypothetical protein
VTKPITGALLALALSACSSTPSTTCPSAQQLLVVGYTTGSTPYSGDALPLASSPYPTSATFLYFAVAKGATISGAGNALTVAGTPLLKGSDGSRITAGNLAAIVGAVDNIPDLYGYSSSVSGLEPNVTYTISFASLRGIQSGCSFPAETAGSFATN